MDVHSLKKSLIAAFALVLAPWLFIDCAQAAPGEVLSGEYVLIVNTDLSNSRYEDGYVDMPQSSGTIYFDPSGGRPVENLNSSVQTAVNDEAAIAADSSGRLTAVRSNTPVGASLYSLGQVKRIGDRSYSLAAIGEHCFIWMDETIINGYVSSGRDVYTVGAAAAKVYDEGSYPVIRSFDAQNILYYADGSGKLSILLQSGSSSGKFDSSDTYESNGGVTAIHINGSSLPSDFTSFGPLFAHECQHALSYTLETLSDEDYSIVQLWLNEALSIAAMDSYTKGHDGNGWLNGLINNSDYLRGGKSFLYSTYPGETEANYSMPFLFLRYLNTQANGGYELGGDFYSKFYQASGMGSVYSPWRIYDSRRIEYVLRQYAPTADWDFKQALINFYIAIQVQANEGVYGFFGDPVISRKVSGYPIYGGTSGVPVNIEKGGAIMVKTLNGSFTVPADAGTDIVFAAFSPNQYARGLQTEGTETDPHLISNAEELSYIWDSEYNHDHFLLISDFEADEGYYNFWADNYYNYNMDANQRHMPDFYGVLDGNGHTISGQEHPLCTNNYGEIENLVINCDIQMQGQTVGAVACTNYGSIDYCSVHGKLSFPEEISSYYNNSYAWMGGIAGDMDDDGGGSYPAKITRCMSDVNIVGELDVFQYFYIGGILGSSSVDSGKTDMENCYSSAKLELKIKDKLPGAVALGGITGTPGGALEKNCYSTASVSFTNENGGDMSDKLHMGRCFGRAAYNSVFENIYSLGGQSACGDRYEDNELCIVSPAQMLEQSTYAGFDFDGLWMMPQLSAEYKYPVFRPLRSALTSNLRGDADQDGKLTVGDVLFICRHIAGTHTLDTQIVGLCDIGRNNKLDISDAVLLCRYIARIISEFPA